MKLLEYEAKEIFSKYGIPVPKGVLIRAPKRSAHLPRIGDAVVLKAQVDVSGREGRRRPDAEDATAVETAGTLLPEIKGVR